jgi:hypothetical protein
MVVVKLSIVTSPNLLLSHSQRRVCIDFWTSTSIFAHLSLLSHAQLCHICLILILRSAIGREIDFMICYVGIGFRLAGVFSGAASG